MGNKGKHMDIQIKTAALFLMIVMMLNSCGKANQENPESETAPPVENTPEAALPTVTPLTWETPVIELGAEYLLSEDVKDYISISDDSYEGYTLENTVDIYSPGEYEIRISGPAESFTFPVVVEDTTCPEMELLLGYDVVTPGSVVSADTVFASAFDNDPEYVYGFYGLETVTDEEPAIPEAENLSYECQEHSGMTKEEISETVTLPEEEGLYLVYAAVLDRSGNIVTSPIYFLTDGTGPQIGLRKNKVTLYLDQTYDFHKGVTLKDNVFPEEECTYRIDEEELANFQDHLQNGQAGTYSVTYYAEDPLGNTAEKTLTVTLTERPAPQENNGSIPQDGGSTPQSGTSAERVYDLAMAQAAFAAVNEYRTANGLDALIWNDSVYESCTVRAAEIADSFSHTRTNGESCFTALTVSFRYAGENIAAGQPTAQSVADAWWNSPGHKANILKESYSQAAIACYYANGMYHWVNLFIG